MKQYKNPTVIEEFRKRFPRVSEMFTAPAKGELTDIEQFLDEQLEKKEEEVVERIKEQSELLKLKNKQKEREEKKTILAQRGDRRRGQKLSQKLRSPVATPNEHCACGETKMEESDFCKNCI